MSKHIHHGAKDLKYKKWGFTKQTNFDLAVSCFVRIFELHDTAFNQNLKGQCHEKSFQTETVGV